MEKHTKAGSLPTAEEFFEQDGTYPELAIEFAKLHVEAALEAVNEKLPEFRATAYTDIILSAYPLTNIK